MKKVLLVLSLGIVSGLYAASASAPVSLTEVPMDEYKVVTVVPGETTIIKSSNFGGCIGSYMIIDYEDKSQALFMAHTTPTAFSAWEGQRILSSLSPVFKKCTKRVIEKITLGFFVPGEWIQNKDDGKWEQKPTSLKEVEFLEDVITSTLGEKIVNRNIHLYDESLREELNEDFSVSSAGSSLELSVYPDGAIWICADQQYRKITQ